MKTDVMRTEAMIFSELSGLCRQPGYIHAVAFLCFRDNVIAFRDEVKPKDMLRLFSSERLVRTEISTLIGLLVKGNIDLVLATPEVTQSYIDRSDALLKELHDAMSSAMTHALTEDRNAAPSDHSFDQGTLFREPIFYGGESAYGFQYRDFAADKYRDDANWLSEKKGFTIESALRVVRSITAIQNRKVTLSHASFLKEPAENWTLLPSHMFSAREVVEESGVPKTAVECVLRAFTFEGENEQFESLIDFNATNAAPLLRVDDENYLLFQYYSLVEALYESPYFWMVKDKSYLATASEHRGRFTEDFAAKRLASVFGKSNVHQNIDLVAKKGTKLGEIDVLVEHGDRLIVLQAKSKRLTLEARKGNDGRIREDFQKAIQDSYDQALGCARQIATSNCSLQKRDGTKLQLRFQPKEIYLFCVVADHYPALSFQSRQFLKYEVEPPIRPPFVMDVFLLDAMTEMLDSPLRLLSFIRQRAEYAERLGMTHELSVLAYHLKRNLWLDDDNSFVMLGDDVSVELDIAMCARRDGMPGAQTPEGILTRFSGTTFERLIKQIEERAHPSTIELGLTLLTVDEKSCGAINEGTEHVVRMSRSDRSLHDFTIGFGAWGEGLTIHCNPSASDEESVERLWVHCDRRKYAEKAARWYGVCLDLKGEIRFGVVLDYTWEQSSKMDSLTSRMQAGRPTRDIAEILRSSVAKKVGRNDRCPCGSGLKYKKCCIH
ncbi:SEC-C metal-binding domain-containing protein [Dyella sp. Tek66A03]|uniref:SEC-C metal-binding domain-containing protein n=1 Tax=Dyella sp. Tek66A03 TaxID=3458298 RepID=UPI00403EE81E